MKLISSNGTVRFLAQAAPKPWVERMLLWMILQGEISPYFTKGKVQPYTSVWRFTLDLREEAGESSGSKMDALIRENWDEEFANRLVGKNEMDRVDDDPFEWDDPHAPRFVDVGPFLYAKEIDWEAGTVVVDFVPSGKDRLDFMFLDEDMFGSEFEDPDFDIVLQGMMFEKQAVEMLLPSQELANFEVSKSASNVQRRATGRPPKWDWEGAMTFVVAQAQHPDGLPTGQGAQARIEELIANWFTDSTGDAPSTSQIRKRASNIMAALERSKTSKTE